ncbi:GntR family transcriptional regulator [Oleiagrimonas sp. C23AA]|uniref:GntR family transcriptional regulator n=1 Tax=Oleiagrimonas sp. C23AA TaxID=2719047 RepID=UPI001422AD92|nr:GntR family transcriptional regulator [Oleiagrimonas sp. C23AA]NII12143.1 GntR family transcriptional regulator [Oleiagrimonas sp. C23AA]
MQAALISEFERMGMERAGVHAPAYLRLRRAIRRSVESGVIEPGQALPSEREMARQLSLSRVTVRKAIAGLVEDGLLMQRHGAGTFVAERIIKPLSRLTSFTEDLRARGLNPRVVFLSREVGEVTPEEAMALNLSPGASVVRLHRLRFAGDDPLAVERTAVPHDILSDPMRVAESLYDALEAQGQRPVRALQRLRAVNLTAEPARQLKLPVGAAGLALERRAFLANGRLVEFTQSYYRGDAYDFVAELQAE